MGRWDQLSPPPVLGLLFLVVLLLVVAGLGSWGYLQWLDARSWESRAAELNAQLEALNETMPKPSAEPDLAPPGVIRGRMILKNNQGRRIPIPGARIRLFDRASLEKFLWAEVPGILKSDAPNPLVVLLAQLPKPLETTTSDTSGNYAFHPPEPGDYVVQTSVLDKTTGSIRAWFLAVDSRDPLNTPVNFTEANAVAVLVPMLIPADGR